jgi:hypothetical protein
MALTATSMEFDELHLSAFGRIDHGPHRCYASFICQGVEYMTQASGACCLELAGFQSSHGYQPPIFSNSSSLLINTSILLPTPPSTVSRILTDFSSWPQWQTMHLYVKTQPTSASTPLGVNTPLTFVTNVEGLPHFNFTACRMLIVRQTCLSMNSPDGGEMGLLSTMLSGPIRPMNLEASEKVRPFNSSLQAQLRGQSVL